MCDMYDEACFWQKIFTDELNMGLAPWAWVKKTSHGKKTH